jgi:hypothetical protein
MKEGELTGMGRDCQDKEKEMNHSCSYDFCFHPAFSLYPVYPVHPC